MSSGIASAVVWFALLKAVFAFLGWLSQESADGKLRRRLDRLFDWLDRRSAADLIRFAIRLLLRRVRVIVRRPLVTAGWLAIFGSVANAVALCSALGIYVWRSGGDWTDIRPLLERAQIIQRVSFCILGGVFYGVAFLVTVWSLRYAATARKATVPVVIAEMIFGYLSFSWPRVALWVSTVIALPYYPELAGYTNIRPVFGREQLVEFVTAPVIIFARLSGGDDLGYSLVFAVMGFVASGVVLAHVWLEALLLTLKVLPRWTHDLLQRAVFLVTTDKAPVLSQLGTACGALGAIVALLVDK